MLSLGEPRKNDSGFTKLPSAPPHSIEPTIRDLKLTNIQLSTLGGVVLDELGEDHYPHLRSATTIVEMPTQEKRRAEEDDLSDSGVRTDGRDHRGYPRKRVALACEVCRLRKTRCDAERPACSFCRKLEIECVYRGPSKNDRARNDEEHATTSRLDKIESTLEAIASALDVQHGKRVKVTSTPMSHHSEVSIASPLSVTSSAKQLTLPRMPNLFAFHGPDPWSYDCTKDFFTIQLQGMTDMREPHLSSNLELSRPHLWRLQQSFVENVLKWLPLFDHETALKHLQAAQLSRYEQETPSLCLVFLIHAIGSLALEATLFTKALHELPGYTYYIRAFGMMRNFPSYTQDLSILQCRVLAAMYFLYAMRPLESWEFTSQVAQNCIFLLKSGQVDEQPAIYRDAFERIYWISYIIDSELEICLELPSSGLRNYETIVPLPSSHYEEEGMYYLLALSSLRKLMVEVVQAVGLKGSTVATYAPVVVMELRNQIDDWYRHLPSSLRFPADHSLLFDKRRAYLRCQYHALIAVVFWPFVPRSKESHYSGKRSGDEDSERVARGSNECLSACRHFLKGADEILTQRTIDSHVIVRSYFSLATILLLTLPGADSDETDPMEDRMLLEYAIENLSHWKVVPFLQKPLFELETMARLKGLNIPSGE